MLANAYDIHAIFGHLPVVHLLEVHLTFNENRWCSSLAAKI